MGGVGWGAEDGLGETQRSTEGFVFRFHYNQPQLSRSGGFAVLFRSLCIPVIHLFCLSLHPVGLGRYACLALFRCDKPVKCVI